MKKKNTLNFYLFVIIKNLASLLQVGCFVYAFACVFYWFLSLTDLPFVENIEFLFLPVFDFVQRFYNQEQFMSGVADLTGIIACVVFIVFAIILNFLINFIEYQEEIYYINLKKQHKLNDLIAQKQIEQEYIREMRKYNRFIVLVNFKVQQIKSYLFENNIQESDLKNVKNSLIAELFNSLDAQYISAKTRHTDESFFVFGNIENTSQCIQNIMSSIQELSKKYSNLDISLSYDITFDAISSQTNLKEELEFLEKVMQLNYNDSLLTTSLFKTCYELISKSKLNFTVLGTFQFLVAGKSQNYELYSVKIQN